MNRNKKKTDKQSWILSLLGSILLLTLVARTESGQAFLSYAKEMAEDMPFVSKVAEFHSEIWKEWENEFPNFIIRNFTGEREDVGAEETVRKDTASATEEPGDNEQISSSESETVFLLNHSSYFPHSLKIVDNHLTLCGIPEESGYRYIMLTLKTPDGSEIYKDTSHRNSNGEVSFSLRTVKKSSNVLKMLMYANSKQDGTYTSFLELPIEKTDSGWRFVASPAYVQNSLFAQDERTDENALAYYLKPSRKIQSDDALIRETANQITADVTDTYEKALLIHDWVSDNIYYDNDALYKRADGGSGSAIDTLSSRRGVCAGYANLTCALLRAAGIPAKTVSGYALGISGGNEFPADALQGKGDTNHAWNEAFVNGRWISLDTTWDSENAYEYGEITKSDGCNGRRYFDISRELLAQNHAVMDSNNYQEIFLYYNSPQMETAKGKKAFNAGLTPYTKKGYMMAPIGAIIEEMGGSCEWHKKSGYYDRLECNVNGHYLQIWPTLKNLVIDHFEGEEGKELTFDVAPEVVNGYTMVQVDLTFSSIECEVTWDDNQGRMVIGYTT